MAKGDPLSRYQQRIVNNFYEHRDTASLHKLGEIVSELYLHKDDRKASDKLWAQAGKALERVGAHPGKTASIISRRNIEDLALFLGDLTLGKGTADLRPAAPTTPATPAAGAQPAPTAAAPTSAPAPSTAATTGATPAPIDPGVLKGAMKAFRKRIKLMKLDEESGLGVGPMSGGRHSGIVAIQPPNSYPREVWEELVKQGKLKPAGSGCYALGPKADH